MENRSPQAISLNPFACCENGRLLFVRLLKQIVGSYLFENGLIIHAWGTSHPHLGSP